MDEEISAEELRDLLESDAAVRVLDIRSPSAFRQGHLPGSENVPFGELTDRIEAVADADRVVTVCPHGEASVQAARLIGSYEGFSGEVRSLSSGIDDWPYDLETGDDGAASEGGETAADDGAGAAAEDGETATDDGAGAAAEDGETATDEGPDAPF